MYALLRLAVACLVAFTASAQAEPIELWIDADYSVNSAAAEAIELGVETALALHGAEIGGVDIAVVPLDHRGNVTRSHHTMQRYLESDNALAIIGGLHSPPYLTHREFLNEHRILTLLPWSAAGPITRALPGYDNWIFRLSVDDFQAGPYLVREAVERGGCARVALVLLESGWGRANLKTLSAELGARGLQPAIVKFFDNAIGEASAATLARDIAEAEPDCGILVSNWNSATLLVSALAEHVPDFRVFSHWGITGGAFAEHVPYETRNAVGLSVLQTCGLRREQDGNETLRAALAANGSGADSLTQMAAPTGFVHAYDLTRILLAAIGQASTTDAWATGGIDARRAVVKHALESLDAPVAGILDTYARPFRSYSAEDPDAHEALGLANLCMARFGPDGKLEDAD